jgi:CheY-like chemotaxis protein
LEILIVDDEPYNLMLSEVILKKHGAKTTCAESGKEALAKLEDNYFDIILADLQMPEIDGYMLAQKIREKFVDVPLIALTANVMQGERDLILRVGFNGILLKPYKEHELLKMIAENSPVVIGEDPDAAVVIMPEELKGAALYDLGEVKIFTDNDNAVLISVIESFIENNSVNVEQLSRHIGAGNLEGVRNTAHKMLPSYTHFKVHELVVELKRLESADAPEKQELQNIFSRIESASKMLFVQLKKEIETLKEKIQVE